MSLVIRWSPSSLTAEQYDSVVRRLTEEGGFPPDGLDYEVCFGQPGTLRVSQVWDSQEQLDAFGARLMPILADVGIEPGDPEVFEVHNTQEQLDAFGARLMPILADVGIEPGDPEVFEVHNIIKR